MERNEENIFLGEEEQVFIASAKGQKGPKSPYSLHPSKYDKGNSK